MDFCCLFDSLSDIVGVRAPAEMDGNGMLAGSNTDDGWWTRKKCGVLGKVADSEGGRHNN